MAAKLIYGTTNPAKVQAMRINLENLGVEIAGMAELGVEIPDVEESGKSPLENARKKALAYFDVLKKPVFSCDSGLFFDEVTEDEQPGVHVRNVGGKRLSDDEMLFHYSSLAKKYGKLTAHYKNAVCLVLDENHVYDAMWQSMESERFYIVPKPHEKRVPGFPLDSLSVDIASGKYYYDLDMSKTKRLFAWEGFVKFFADALGLKEGV